MNMLFSALTLGFYDLTINTSIPVDAVPISDEKYNSLLDGQSTGQIISADAAGNPILTNPN